jgi:hypothetical protein
MDKNILTKIKNAKILTEQEMAEIEGKLFPMENKDAKNPKDEVAPKMPTEKPAVPAEPLKEETVEGKTEVKPEMGEIDAKKPVDEPVVPGVEPEPAIVDTTNEMVDEAGMPNAPVEPKKAAAPEVGAITTGDMEQVKTTISTLENKIRALEDVLSKLSVNAEPEEEDFGISGKGKTTAGGEAYEDKASALIKKMGGFSR